jgi:dolichyl-phosphate beta-glucosyltransferase
MVNSRGKYRLFADGDLSTPNEKTTSLLNWLDQGYDICIASRAISDSQVIKPQPFFRERMGISYNKIIRITLALPFSDTQCGFKCIKGYAADSLQPLLRVDRFGVDVEMLSVAKRIGFTIKEVGTKWINSPATKVNMLSDPLNMLGAIFKRMYHNCIGSYKGAPK